MKRALQVKCGKCGFPFVLSVTRKATVSCPSCSCILFVRETPDSELPVTALPLASGQTVRAPPPQAGRHSARFRCLDCTKTFPFEGPPEGEFSKPPCPRCKSGKVQALTPVAAVISRGSAGDRQAKMARFVRGNFKVLSEIRAYMTGFEDLLRRASLPEHTERRLLQRAQVLRDDVLSTVESSANEKLKSRMRGIGVASGEDLF